MAHRSRRSTRLTFLLAAAASLLKLHKGTEGLNLNPKRKGELSKGYRLLGI